MTDPCSLLQVYRREGRDSHAFLLTRDSIFESGTEEGNAQGEAKRNESHRSGSDACGFHVSALARAPHSAPVLGGLCRC